MKGICRGRSGQFEARGVSADIMRIARERVPGGRSGATLAIAELTRERARTIGVFQAKRTKNWAEPRDVRERTSRTPATPRSATETGRVTRTDIWEKGRSLVVTITEMRGKSMEG